MVERRRLASLIPFVAFGAGLRADGQQATPADSPAPVVRVHRTDDFSVDGEGSAPAWSNAAWEPLTPRAAAKGAHPTRFKMLYSSAGLYVLMDGEDRTLTAVIGAAPASIIEEGRRSPGARPRAPLVTPSRRVLETTDSQSVQACVARR